MRHANFAAVLTWVLASAVIGLLAGCARGGGAHAPGLHPAVSARRPLVLGETWRIDSRVLGEARRINVFVPTAYGEAFDEPLPVLYMPDGGMAEDFLHVAGLVQVLTSNGSMRPCIVVGIENTVRRRDLTFPTTVASDLEAGTQVGGAAAFRRFIREELKPAVAARHRVTGESAIIGESLAGLFVVETYAREPALFDAYIAIDPSLWWDGGSLVREFAAMRREGGGGSTSMSVSWSGEPQIAADCERLRATLAAAAGGGGEAVLRWESLPEETHATVYHPAALRALPALLRPTTPAN